MKILKPRCPKGRVSTFDTPIGYPFVWLPREEPPGPLLQYDELPSSRISVRV